MKDDNNEDLVESWIGNNEDEGQCIWQQLTPKRNNQETWKVEFSNDRTKCIQ